LIKLVNPLFKENIKPEVVEKEKNVELELKQIFEIKMRNKIRNMEKEKGGRSKSTENLNNFRMLNTNENNLGNDHHNDKLKSKKNTMQ